MPQPERRRASNTQTLFAVAAIALLNCAGFFVLFAIIAPQHLKLAGGGVFGVGLGLTAYTLGIRHAFDADHIAAIDNVTRKLQGEGKDARSVGFFFSLGHSTIVVAMGALIALGAGEFVASVGDDGSALGALAGNWGPTVAGIFLLLIGAINLVVVIRIGRVFLRMRRGEFDEAELERQLESRGAMSRLFARLTRSINAPWQMYPVGAMFGLGFDTATEIALLVLAGGAAAGGLPFYAVMCLPVLFAAGMTLFDMLNSTFMDAAYGWAFERPVRRVYYNLTVTSMSVVAAFAIGAISLLQLPVDLAFAGYALVALFAFVWAAAAAAWHFGRVEERWSAPLRE
jgi:high-affinity nickel-transport protein